MLTAAVRDLKRQFPQYQIGIDNQHTDLWLYNPYIDRNLKKDDPGVQFLKLGYANQLTYAHKRDNHFVGSFHRAISKQLKIDLHLDAFKPDIHLGQPERRERLIEGHQPYWIIVCGGKSDLTCKWWNPDHAQKVVDHFQGKIRFVQAGAERSGHKHWLLKNTINMVGKTTLREFVRLMYHAQGVICPVTFAMHLAAGVTYPYSLGTRPCVVVAGGREPPHWEAYPGHRFLHTIGSLKCCEEKACWRMRCHKVGDGRRRDHYRTCELPVHLEQYKMDIPKCMDMIDSKKVIAAVESYFEGDLISYL